MTPRDRAMLAFMVWLCVYPSVLFFSYVFVWLEIDVALWLEIGISTAISVPLISTVCIPWVEKALAAVRHESPAELKMRQAEGVEGPDAVTVRDGSGERPLHRAAE